VKFGYGGAFTRNFQRYTQQLPMDRNIFEYFSEETGVRKEEAASGNCADSWKAAGGERGDGALGELP